MPSKDSDQQPLHIEEKPSGPDNPPKRRACSGYCCYKALVVIYSLLFLLMGICLFGMGVWLGKMKGMYDSVNDALTVPVILAVVLGIFMVIFAFIGLIGAAREKVLLLRIFLAIAIIVFLGQIIIGVLAFIYREESITVVQKQFQFAIERYDKDNDVRRGVDYIQQDFDCCGLDGYKDWEVNDLYSCEGSDNQNKSCSVPDSCCVRRTEDCGFDIRAPNTTSDEVGMTIYKNGCVTKFRKWVDKNLDIIGPTALGLCLLHLFGIFMTYFFITSVQDRVWLFQYRKKYYN